MASIISDSDADPWVSLLGAVIIQAANDYRESYRDISLGYGRGNADYLIADALNFIRNGWFCDATGADADYIEKGLNADIIDTLREDYLHAWRDIRSGSARRRRKGVSAERCIRHFVEKSRFNEVSDASRTEMVDELKYAALKDLLGEYSEALAKMASGKRATRAKKDIDAIKSFMRSDKFKELTDLDAEKLIARLEKGRSLWQAN